MIYAPVAVTTLNRYDHLKRLIDSLERNTWAENTDLIISLDYPPSEKYVDGYKKTKDYLKWKKNNNKFKKILLFEQEKNLGPIENFVWLKDYLIQNYDRWITAEDDIVFAPNFLVYMDKGLELFEDDESVQDICGCHDLGDIDHQGNVIKHIWYHAHGVATWRDKAIRIKDNYLETLLSPKNYSFASMLRLRMHNRFLFVFYVCNVLCNRTGWMWIDEKEIRLFDNTRTLYNFFTNKCSISPEKYKSHTCGIDGSGVHQLAVNIDPDEEWPLDTEYTFEFDIPNNFKVSRASYKILDKRFEVGHIYLLYVWFQYVVFRLSGDDWEKVNKMVYRIREILSSNKR